MTTNDATGDPAAPGVPAAAGPAEASVQANGGNVVAVLPQPEFDRLEDWLTEYFLPMFRRTLGGELRWCRQWWRHGEAISRLNSLWHSWEVLRIRPGTGIATWYREHLDHQLPLLLGARGPFYQCSEDTHREPHQATADPAPDGWWALAEPEPAEETGGHRGNDATGEGVAAGDGRA